MAWTDEKIEELIKLHADGLSNELISQRLGDKTRNAVLGKLHRLGLCGTKERPHKSHIRKKSEAGGWRTKSQKPLKPKRVKAGAPVMAPKPAPEPFQGSDFELFVPVAKRKGIAEIEHGECRWPHGEPGTEVFHFCGNPVVEGQVYCKPHCDRAYRPPTVATGGHFRLGGHPGSGAPRMPASDKPREKEEA